MHGPGRSNRTQRAKVELRRASAASHWSAPVDPRDVTILKKRRYEVVSQFLLLPGVGHDLGAAN